jgi:hypothetical protein
MLITRAGASLPSRSSGKIGGVEREKQPDSPSKLTDEILKSGERRLRQSRQLIEQIDAALERGGAAPGSARPAAATHRRPDPDHAQRHAAPSEAG